MSHTDDNFELKDEYDFSSGVVGRFYNPHKKPTTIRLDDDIILYFKKMAGEQKIGYQTLMNSALREFIANRGVSFQHTSFVSDTTPRYTTDKKSPTSHK